jgi:hypothetical protein
VVSVVAFDQPLNCIDERKRTPKIDKLINAVDELFYLSRQLSFSLPIYRYYPTKEWKKFVAASDIVYRFICLILNLTEINKRLH